MSENKKEQEVAPSMNPEERPDLQDYRSTDKESANTNTCQDCGKVFSKIEELTAHYKKDHPESF
jgi:C2H2 type zinc finger protein